MKKIMECPAAGENASAAVSAAVMALSDGDTLCLQNGRYDFYPEGAYRKEYYISNNDSGVKSIAFPLIGKKNIVIDGGGAELVFHGRILPFAVDGSENITIRDLSVDYAAPFYAQAKITEADTHHTTLFFEKPDFSCRVENGNFCFYSETDGWENRVEQALALEFSWNADRTAGIPSPFLPPYFPYSGPKKDHGFLGGMFRDVKLEQLDENRIVMYMETPHVHTVGNYLVMTHSDRCYPGFFLTHAKNVTLSGIRLYHSASMGVIAQCSEDITLDTVTAKPRPGSGRMLSVNADATHFVNCRGSIVMRNCTFVSMMDDACNIHGIYGLYRERKQENVISVSFGHGQQKGIDFCRVGDTVAVIDSEQTKTLMTAAVTKQELLSPEEYILTLDRAVPVPGKHYVIENLSTAPDVHITDCESGNNRPRGFLLSTAGRVLVERCTFYNMSQGIQLGGEMRDWYESGAVKDVTIRDNDFADSAFAGGYAITIVPSLREEDARMPFHGTVVIENNRFTQAEPRMLFCRLTEKLVFRKNTFIRDTSLPSHPIGQKDGICIDRDTCTEVLVDGNTVV